MRGCIGKDTTQNATHGSDSTESASRELNFFFKSEDTFAMIKPNAMSKKDEIVAEIGANGFEVVKQKQFRLARAQAEQRRRPS